MFLFYFINVVCLLPVVIIRKIVRHGKPVLESVLPARKPSYPTFVYRSGIRTRKSCRTVIAEERRGKGNPYIDVGFRTVNITAARVDFLSVTSTAIRARRILCFLIIHDGRDLSVLSDTGTTNPSYYTPRLSRVFSCLPYPPAIRHFVITLDHPLAVIPRSGERGHSCTLAV